MLISRYKESFWMGKIAIKKFRLWLTLQSVNGYSLIILWLLRFWSYTVYNVFYVYILFLKESDFGILPGIYLLTISLRAWIPVMLSGSFQTGICQRLGWSITWWQCPLIHLVTLWIVFFLVGSVFHYYVLSY